MSNFKRLACYFATYIGLPVSTAFIAFTGARYMGRDPYEVALFGFLSNAAFVWLMDFLFRLFDAANFNKRRIPGAWLITSTVIVGPDSSRLLPESLSNNLSRCLMIRNAKAEAAKPIVNPKIDPEAYINEEGLTPAARRSRAITVECMREFKTLPCFDQPYILPLQSKMT